MSMNTIWNRTHVLPENPRLHTDASMAVHWQYVHSTHFNNNLGSTNMAWYLTSIHLTYYQKSNFHWRFLQSKFQFFHGLSTSSVHATRHIILCSFICRKSYRSIIPPSIGSSDKLFRKHDFFLKKLLWGPRKLKLRHLWLRWSWPNVLAYQNFWSTL